MEMKKGSETMPNPEVKAKPTRRRFSKDEVPVNFGRSGQSQGNLVKWPRYSAPQTILHP